MTKKPASTPATTPAAEYVPTEKEREIIARTVKKRQAEASIKLEYTDGTLHIAPNHPDKAMGTALLMDALGANDASFLAGAMSQLVNAGAQGKSANADGVNFLLSVVKSVQPRDQLEAMLAMQMGAVHMAAMTFARRLAHVENIPQQDSAERAFNKLTRTFTTQMEALKRYRSGGEQKMTVEHVHVHEGGQAIVGNVTNTPKHGGGNAEKN